METLWTDMYNGGKEGVKTQLTSLIATIAADAKNHAINEDEREKRQEKRDKRMGIILTSFGLILAALALIFAIPPAVQSLRDLLKSDIEWRKLYTGKNDRIDAINRQQDASPSEAPDRPSMGKEWTWQTQTK